MSSTGGLEPTSPSCSPCATSSGSVADFAGFTLTLISALAGELADTRTFAFVDTVDEITEIVQRPAPVEPWQILQRGRVLGADGHSTTGPCSAGSGSATGGPGLTHRTTVVIAGDARTNYRPERADQLRTMAAGPGRSTGSTPSRGPSGTPPTR